MIKKTFFISTAIAATVIVLSGSLASAADGFEVVWKQQTMTVGPNQAQGVSIQALCPETEKETGPKRVTGGGCDKGDAGNVQLIQTMPTLTGAPTPPPEEDTWTGRGWLCKWRNETGTPQRAVLMAIAICADTGPYTHSGNTTPANP